LRAHWNEITITSLTLSEHIGRCTVPAGRKSVTSDFCTIFTEKIAIYLNNNYKCTDVYEHICTTNECITDTRNEIWEHYNNTVAYAYPLDLRDFDFDKDKYTAAWYTGLAFTILSGGIITFIIIFMFASSVLTVMYAEKKPDEQLNLEWEQRQNSVV